MSKVQKGWTEWAISPARSDPEELVEWMNEKSRDGFSFQNFIIKGSYVYVAMARWNNAE